MTVLLDIHTLKDSQNGFDNSGQAMGFQWTTALNQEFTSDHTFEHCKYPFVSLILQFLMNECIFSQKLCSSNISTIHFISVPFNFFKFLINRANSWRKMDRNLRSRYGILFFHQLWEYSTCPWCDSNHGRYVSIPSGCSRYWTGEWTLAVYAD